MTFLRLAVLFALGGAGVFGCSGENEPNEDAEDETSRVEACLRLCERARECPNAAPLDCAEWCAAFESDPCQTEASLALECLAAGDACHPSPPECADETDSYYLCLDNADTGGCAPETAPSSASCESICAAPYPCFDSEAACAESCSNGAARSELVGCASEYRTMIACISTCTYICAVTIDDCTDVRMAFLDCEAEYCAANSDSDACRIETI